MVIPPYAASFGWYAAWIHALSEGMNPDDAIAEANRQQGISGKGFARCRLRGRDGDTLLSVAVVGGSHSLLRRGSELRAELSGHGNWPHAHLGALEAICGRAPYYQHLIPKLRDAIGNPPKSLRELNLSIHDDIATFLGVVATLTPEARERGNEIAADINPELSIIDPLMRFGKETLLALLCRAGKM
ncbi:MAG: WbqC family protein [Muribaculaceae bacterium]